MNRPNWDEYFMRLCFLVASRSLDPDTKHGSVIVDQNHSILTTGYNSPPRGMDDSKVPLTRPEKYAYFIHSECAAIANAAKNGIKLDGSKIYITGWPCSPCVRTIINAGIKEIIFGPKTSFMNCDKEVGLQMLKNQDIMFREYIPEKNYIELILR